MANSGESGQQRLQRFSQSWQLNQVWSGRRESNSRSQLGKLSVSRLPRTLIPWSGAIIPLHVRRFPLDGHTAGTLKVISNRSGHFAD
jgi:hypothetical protein